MDSGRSVGQDRGFTLIELLVVIVILGVLATVVVFAVGGVVDRGEVSALEGDAKTLEQAEESHYALHGEYATETELVAAGLLRDESELHQITVLGAGEDYTIAQAGSGGGGGSPESETTTTLAAPQDETTTTPAPTTTIAEPPSETTTTTLAPVATTYAGQAGLSYGTPSSPKTLVIIGSGSGTAVQTMWNEITAAGTALRVDTEVIWLSGVSTKAEVDAIRTATPAPTYIIVPVQVPMTGSPGHPYVGQYLNSVMASPGAFWWGQGQTQAGHPITESIGYYISHF